MCPQCQVSNAMRVDRRGAVSSSDPAVAIPRLRRLRRLMCRQNGLSEPSDAEPKSFCSSLGAFREAPGASWGLPGPHGKLACALSESSGIFIGLPWDRMGTLLGSSSPFMWLRLHKWWSNPIHPGREGAECFSEHHGVPCIVIIRVWREGGWVYMYKHINK
jgi:hypothetical protein